LRISRWSRVLLARLPTMVKTDQSQAADADRFTAVLQQRVKKESSRGTGELTSIIVSSVCAMISPVLVWGVRAESHGRDCLAGAHLRSYHG
jgi:hypothetical protein